MKKNNFNYKILTITSIMIFIMGVGVFMYPAVSNYLAEKFQREVITIYDDTIEKKKQEELNKEWENAKIYNDNLAGDPLHDPFIPGSGYALPDNYLHVLNVNGDGVMGYVEIPKISVHLPIFHGTNEDVLQKGSGHLEGSSLPIGGMNRHSVLSAHRGLPSAELFTNLDKVVVGDVFYLHILDKTLAYKVDKIDIIEPDELQNLKVEKDRDLVTLMTCTPYAVNTHRLLVRGYRINYVEEEVIVDNNKPQYISNWKIEYLISICIGILLLIILLFIYKRQKNEKEN